VRRNVRHQRHLFDPYTVDHYAVRARSLRPERFEDCCQQVLLLVINGGVNRFDRLLDRALDDGFTAYEFEAAVAQLVGADLLSYDGERQLLVAV